MSGLTLGPRSLERPADSGFTLIGVLDTLAPARVDGGGGLQLDGSSWMLDWWVGGDDRWYMPAREATVRQRRVGAGPVIETSVRIPSGDALQRIYATNVGGEQAIVVEFENASPVPMALALAVRPIGIDGTPAPLEIALDRAPASSGAIATLTVGVDDPVVIGLPKKPSEFASSNEVDLVDTVSAGRLLEGPDLIAGAGANAVALYPIAHRTTLRFVVGRAVDPRSLPTADDVANGWSAVLDRGGRFEFPDNGVTAQAAAARARLMLAANRLPRRIADFEPGAGRVLEGLALSGAVAEVLGALGAFAGSFPTRLESSPLDAAAVMSGIGRASRLADDEAMAVEMLEPAAQLTKLIEKSNDSAATREAFWGLARLLITADQPEPALGLMKRAASLGGEVRPDIPGDAEELATFSERAASSGSFDGDDDVHAARFWLGARGALVGDRPGALDLLPRFPASWRGGNVEVHGAATGHGVASFGIRWHGYRPALLWDVQADEPLIIRCPGLDPNWASTETSGETLLAGSGEALAPVPEAGDSFQ